MGNFIIELRKDELKKRMGSTMDYTSNFFVSQQWIDLAVLNQITIVEQKYEVAVIEAQAGKRLKIDFII